MSALEISDEYDILDSHVSVAIIGKEPKVEGTTSKKQYLLQASDYMYAEINTSH